jgi:hypothetical protein
MFVWLSEYDEHAKVTSERMFKYPAPLYIQMFLVGCDLLGEVKEGLITEEKRE